MAAAAAQSSRRRRGTFPNLLYFVHITPFESHFLPEYYDSDSESDRDSDYDSDSKSDPPPPPPHPRHNNNNHVVWNDYSIYVASLSLEPKLTLNIHYLDVAHAESIYYDVLGTLRAIETVERSLDPLKWSMRVQCSKQYETYSKARNMFAHGGSWYGVWGREQLDILSQITDRGVDISSHVLNFVMKPSPLDDPEKEPSLSITDLFVNILRKHVCDFSDLKTEQAKEEFEKWIQDVAWKAFVVRDAMLDENINQQRVFQEDLLG